MTTEKVIEILKEKFGDIYDYSKVEYVNSKTKICLICPIHGEFWTLLANLKKNNGCPKCSFEKRARASKLKIEDIKRKVYEIHGDKYDLSMFTEYENNTTKFPVICKKHGIFYASVRSLITKKQGCPSCSGNKKYTVDAFVEKANSIHNGRYIYENSFFNGMRNKMKIICPKHGEFLQTPHEHLQGQGCPECGRERTTNARKSNTEEFIKKLNKVTNGKYNTSKINYVNSRTKVCVICPIHGEFWATPNNLLRGRGCPECGKLKLKEEIVAQLKYTTDEFINEAKKVHGDRFTYEKTDFKGIHKKCTITCKKHGDFLTTPMNFLRGHGCPICHESRLEKEVSILLEENGIEFTRQKKFGRQFADFFLPKQGIIIECQGKQHFFETQFGNTKNHDLKKLLNEAIERDIRKYNYIKEKGFNILYYSWGNVLPKDLDNEKFGNIYKDGIITRKKALIDRIRKF